MNQARHTPRFDLMVMFAVAFAVLPREAAAQG
jgi:hypothetical protein